MLAISVPRFRGARLFLGGQKLSRGRRGSCGEPSAKTSTLYEDQNHVAGMVRIDKEMPVSNLRPQIDYVENARAQTRFVTLLGGALAALALFLAYAFTA
jgi:hypothetical protein